MLHLPGPDVVAIHQLVELQRQAVQKVLDGPRKLLHFSNACVRRGDMPPQWFDVDIYFGVSITQLENFFFQFRGLAVRVAWFALSDGRNLPMFTPAD